MTDILDRFFQAAKQQRRTVVLPEGADPRVVTAARRLKDESLAEPILLGSPAELEQAASQAGVTCDDIRQVDPQQSEKFEEYVAAYVARRDVKDGIARRMMKKPLFYGGMMVALGDADTMVAGIAHATASVIQAGALTIGLSAGIETVSSFFLMVLPEFRGQTTPTVHLLGLRGHRGSHRSPAGRHCVGLACQRHETVDRDTARGPVVVFHARQCGTRSDRQGHSGPGPGPCSGLPRSCWMANSSWIRRSSRKLPPRK